MSAIRISLLLLVVGVGNIALEARDSSLQGTAADKPVSCITEGCSAGKECVVVDGAATCVCKRTCKRNKHVVCGSNGQSYLNHCELHRTACIAKQKIQVEHDGYCVSQEVNDDPPEEESSRTTTSLPFPQDYQRPLVCFEIEREELRQLLIDWLKSEVQSDGWFTKGKSYHDIVTSAFTDCDEDSDGFLNADEFLTCMEKNDTIQSTHESLGSDIHILRGLCIDALIGLVDTDHDWQLNLAEFSHSMDPDFLPSKADCQLENEKYGDGYETTVVCNICVCACGNWMCSGLSCENVGENIRPGETKKGDRPTKKERLNLLAGFRASEKISPETVDLEVMKLRHSIRSSPLQMVVEQTAHDHLGNDEV
ncbi:hypothetical protein ScPMuIL_003300 [Solemya velum]